VARRGEAAGVRARASAHRGPVARATDREIGVVAAVLATGSEKAAAHRLGLSHSTVKHHLANARSKCGAATTAQLVWILSPRLPDPTPGNALSAEEELARAPRAAAGTKSPPHVGTIGLIARSRRE
jgi:DNA-binding CsgD family transcriptional regulator